MVTSLKLKNRWNEKRSNRRISHHTVVGISIVSGPLCFFRARRPQFNGEVQDESASGFRLVCERPIHMGAVVKLWINVSCGADLKTIELRGDVVWSVTNGETHEAGIQLRADPAQDMEIWVDAVAEDMRRLDA